MRAIMIGPCLLYNLLPYSCYNFTPFTAHFCLHTHQATIPQTFALALSSGGNTLSPLFISMVSFGLSLDVAFPDKKTFVF
jgi:hypothetical protein